jgi:hypothetical protein
MSPSVLIGAGGENDKASIRLSTKKDNYIPNERKKERAPDSLRAAKALWTRQFPNIKTRSLSATYNCVGLVFGARRTCIDPDQIKMILEDDAYRKLSSDGEVKVGDIVIYIKDNEYEHIGIVIEVIPDILTATHKVTVLSQWGQDGEYIHSVEDVPEQFGRTWEFWTERKLIP